MKEEEPKHERIRILAGDVALLGKQMGCRLFDLLENIDGKMYLREGWDQCLFNNEGQCLLDKYHPRPCIIGAIAK